MSGFFYVAAPYTSAEDKDKRWQEITEQTARLMRMGHNCYSPITHGHPIEKAMGAIGYTPTRERWLEWDMPLLLASKGVIVLKFDGWDDPASMVSEEIRIAKAESKLVFYQDVS